MTIFPHRQACFHNSLDATSTPTIQVVTQLHSELCYPLDFGWTIDQTLTEGPYLIVEFVGWVYGLHETGDLSGTRIQLLTGYAQPLGPSYAAEPGESAGAAAAGNDADIDLWQAKSGILGGQAKIGAAGHLYAETEADPQHSHDAAGSIGFSLQLTIDEVVARSDSDLLVVLAIGFGLLNAISVASTALRSYIVLVLQNTLHYQIGASPFHHLVRLPLTFFEKRHIGDVLSRFSSIEPTLPVELEVNLIGQMR